MTNSSREHPQQPTNSQQESYDAGAKAFATEGKDAANPYPEGTDSSKYWEHGFLDAQKVIEGKPSH